MLVVFTTVPNDVEAEDLARKLVEARLAACVQILPGITSIFCWEGEIQTDSEHLLLIKTSADKWEELSRFISENHGYNTPEIVAVNADNVSPAYLAWLNDTLRQ